MKTINKKKKGVKEFGEQVRRYSIHDNGDFVAYELFSENKFRE